MWQNLRTGAVAWVVLFTAGEVGWQAPTAAEEPKFMFRDATGETGLLPAVAGIQGHAAGWGDCDGDGWPDLYVGTFHYRDTKPNLLLRNREGKFVLDEQPGLRISTRANSAIFADFDNDGDLDLYVSSMPNPNFAKKEGYPLVGCSLFRNDGGGKFVNISAESGACPEAFGGRSGTVLDYDGDGLLDLLVGEDPLPGYNGSATKSSRLFRNLGGLKFKDVSHDVGIPAGIPGLGVLAADFNHDGWPDLFLASHGGGNVLLLNDGKGRYRVSPGSRETFAWPKAGGDNMICGVCAADVNRDGLLDIVIGQHFDSPWKSPVPIRLYLNHGADGESVKFEDVTEKVGLKPLPMKAPHVEIQDFDNDGWPDIYTSIVKFKDGQPYPVIFRNLGVRDGLPQFREEALEVNDFPTTEDRATGRSAVLFEKMLREKKIFYAAAGPTADYDRDGRLDIFLASWWKEAPSLLLKNETAGGGWLDVSVAGSGKLNRQGIGSRVSIYRAGHAGEAEHRLGCQEIAVGYGYVSSHAAIAHFGLGEEKKVDVEVIFPHQVGRKVLKDVSAKERLQVTVP